MKRFWLYLLFVLAVGYCSVSGTLRGDESAGFGVRSASVVDAASQEREILAVEKVFTAPVNETVTARQNNIVRLVHPSGRKHNGTGFSPVLTPHPVKNYPSVFPRRSDNAVANASFVKAADYYIYLLRKIVI